MNSARWLLASVLLFGSAPGLRAQSTNESTGAPKAAMPTAQSWTDKVSISGDIRLRHQTQAEEGSPQRTRERFRARLNLDATVNDHVKAGVRLVTNMDGDPISDNQTMTGSWSDKSFAIDRAFLNITPVDGVNFFVGKVAPPWYRAGDLIFSENVNPEGFAINWRVPGEVVTLFAHGGYWVLEERTKDDDTTMVSGQIGLTLTPHDAVRITLGSSAYWYSTVQGRALLYDPTDSAGNSTTTNRMSDTTTELRYAEGYNEVEGFITVELDTRIPVSVSGQYVVNTEPDRDNKAYLGLITLGKIKQPGSFEVGCQYRYLEKDAVLGVFTESGETGTGTDAKAIAPFLKFRLWKDFDVKFLYSMATKGLDDGHDLNIFKVDLSVKF